MNKDFIKELKTLAKKYNSDILFECCYCGSQRETVNMDCKETWDYITIVQKEKKQKNKK